MNHTSPHPTGRLLVVDDNKVNRLLLGRSLDEQGHHVVMVENGQQALDALHSGAVDLVLLDIQMPVMDGFQVLEQLVQDPHLRDIPVIITSATDEIDSVVRCIEMGAEDYLTKPVNPVLLRARINASLEKKQLRDQQQELIRKFAASEVADELLAKGFHLGGKLVEATALFCDIRAFTAIVETQSPADVIELLNDYFTLMFEAITGHGGIVNQMVGDGLMALFGAPVPQLDRRLQAVLAAREMVEMIDLFNVERSTRAETPIRIGIGIASGPVIAGYVGTQHRATYTCVGDTVNLAARLEAHTKVVGQPILIDEETRRGLNDQVPVEALGAELLKGKAQVVQIFSVPTQRYGTALTVLRRDSGTMKTQYAPESLGA
jgi:class 3 adenylate cyclase